MENSNDVDECESKEVLSWMYPKYWPMYLHIHSLEFIIWKSDVDVNVNMMDMGVDVGMVMDRVRMWVLM